VYLVRGEGTSEQIDTADGSSEHQTAVRFGVSGAVKEFAEHGSASGSSR
jgi:hypothetical protein